MLGMCVCVCVCIYNWWVCFDFPSQINTDSQMCVQKWGSNTENKIGICPFLQKLFSR